MSGFEGRVCVVTGAGAGIGRALSLGLARRGARLAISDIDEQALAGTETLLSAAGAVEVHAAPLDVADREAFTAYADAVLERFGTVNQLYNNAGIWMARSVLESDFEDYERVWSIDVWGVLHGTKLFLPHLIASGEGHLVNLSSINGELAQAETSHYCSAKFAVRGFTDAVRVEMQWGRHPVHVLNVQPGGVHTTIATTWLRRALAEGATPSERDVRLERLFNDKILRLPPDKAAEIILTAVKRNRSRVLVGNDAKLIDLAMRVAPSLVLNTSGKVLHRLWGDPTPPPGR